MKEAIIKKKVSQERVSIALQELSHQVTGQDIRLAAAVMDMDKKSIYRYLRGEVAKPGTGSKLIRVLRRLIIARENAVALPALFERALNRNSKQAA